MFGGGDMSWKGDGGSGWGGGIQKGVLYWGVYGRKLKAFTEGG